MNKDFNVVTHTFERDYDKKQVVMHFYSDLKEILESCFGSEIYSPDFRICGYNSNGSEYAHTLAEVLSSINEMKCWGFCDNKQSIHVWYQKDVEFRELVKLLAHERGHMEAPYYNDNREEIKAGLYQDVTVFAMDVATKLLEPYWE